MYLVLSGLNIQSLKHSKHYLGGGGGGSLRCLIVILNCPLLVISENIHVFIHSCDAVRPLAATYPYSETLQQQYIRLFGASSSNLHSLL